MISLGNHRKLRSRENLHTWEGEPARRQSHRIHAHDELHTSFALPWHVVADARRLQVVAARVADNHYFAILITHPWNALLGDRHKCLGVNGLVLIVDLHQEFDQIESGSKGASVVGKDYRK